ncbi:hypothetical protein B9G49_12135 [Halorubrum sp. SD683]|uniref:hypothetical protein n=1 Tax=Halorubrum TaxID=56688 RepID=UPI000A2D737D|nr:MULTISPECIES: hypothetical protein [Halorubrum]MDB2263466.1 hypothetical protein [Halorubrum ezzemoulense]MDB2275124.1 hypothetical protein [Halorubrum ezzemoulense]OTE99415.1 hypothetical protein B9G49_12135 [Halorubrum sp. SD683]
MTAGSSAAPARPIDASARSGRVGDATRDRSPYLVAAASTGMDSNRDRTGDAFGRGRVIER